MDRLKNIIWQCTITLCIVCLLFLVLEVASFFILKNYSQPATSRKSDKEISVLYPGEDISEMIQMLSETWRKNTFTYSPFVEYSNREFHGDYFNIQKEGYRSVRKLPWPPQQKSLFIFGGSTGLGIGVKDSDTISAYLESKLDFKYSLYNFSTPAQFSTIERIRFFNLVTNGIKPDIAVFIDGLNDFYFYQVPDRSNLRNRLDIASDVNYMYLLKKILSKLNTIKLYFRITNQNIDKITFRYKATDAEIVKALDRLISNRKIINAFCVDSGIECMFVTQPVPTFNYDNSKRPLGTANINFRGAVNCKKGYQLLEDYYRRNPLSNHLNLAYLESEEPMYVDAFHYSNKMNLSIANEIHRKLAR